MFAANIAPTINEMEIRSPGWGASIQLYNQLIQATVEKLSQQDLRLIDVYTAISRLEEKGVALYINPKDVCHLTKAWHELYARLILESERNLNFERNY